MKFIQAKHYTPANRKAMSLIVIHTMEYPEKINAAEAVAQMFHTTTRPASAHYCVDSDSEVQCVLEKDVAYHAPGANSNGIGIEHAGYAASSAADWSDAFSQKMLKRSARIAADICKRYWIPVEYVDVAGLKHGKRGITTHRNVSEAFKKSTHTDPGTSFPMTQYLWMVGWGLTHNGIFQ